MERTIVTQQTWHSKFVFLLYSIKDELNHYDTEVEKREFDYSKYPVEKSNVDIDKLIISTQVCFGRNTF